MSGGVPKRVLMTKTQINTPSKGGYWGKPGIILCNGARSRRAMCNSIQTRAKYCPDPCGPEKCVPPLLPDSTLIPELDTVDDLIGFSGAGSTGATFGTLLPDNLNLVTPGQSVTIGKIEWRINLGEFIFEVSYDPSTPPAGASADITSISFINCDNGLVRTYNTSNFGGGAGYVPFGTNQTRWTWQLNNIPSAGYNEENSFWAATVGKNINVVVQLTGGPARSTTVSDYCTDSNCYNCPVAVQSTGAIVSQIGKITLLTFNTSGTFTLPPNFGKDIEYLVVGGGGSGGVGKLPPGSSVTYGGGGGGAVKTGTIPASTLSSLSLTNPSFIVTVGAGSPGLYSDASNNYSGNIPFDPSPLPLSEPILAAPDATSSSIFNNNSSFTSISAQPGVNGGISFLDPSGVGGATARATQGGSSGNSGPPLFTPGNPGAKGAISGSGSLFYQYGGGGGGGAGTTPSNPASGAPAGQGGKGGDGISSTITGKFNYYGGGGGGGGTTIGSGQAGGIGGLGGGGRGVGNQDGPTAGQIGKQGAGGLAIPAAVNGTPNTGGGGGGVSPNDETDEFNSGAGGSGVVILRYVNDC